MEGATVPADIYGIGLELSTVLSVVAVLISGNWLSLSWSIGGAMPSTGGGLLGSLLPSLFGTGQGLSRSHNKYVSIIIRHPMSKKADNISDMRQTRVSLMEVTHPNKIAD